MNNNKEKFLFLIDLDGTTLSNSVTAEMSSITEQAIKDAIELGHIVCIVTGRNWMSTKKVYQQLNLNTVVANFNGAHIHNPSDSSFIPIVKYLNLNEILYILGDKKIKDWISNIAIEGPSWVHLQKKDSELEQIFGFKNLEKVNLGIETNKMPLQPTGAVFEVKKGADFFELKTYLDKKYGDLGEFSAWSKGEGKEPVVDITSVGINKGRVIPLLMRYYDIEYENTVSIGDGFNDIPMFVSTYVSVAMSNSDPRVKKQAVISSSKSNKDGGVGVFINKFLKDPVKYQNKAKEFYDKKSKSIEAT